MRSDDQHIRARAAQTAPATQRRVARAGDVAVLTRTEPYAGFFAVEEQDLRFRRFDGTLSDPVNRATFVAGDAVTVLPYDPVRDRVLLVEQFRVGPHLRGDANPWQLEAIAGRIDPGETVEATAIREAIPAFAREIKGYDLADAVLTGVETRTSSPIRIARDDAKDSDPTSGDMQSLNTIGLYPTGEGAGYAGGILSASIDGIKVAEAVSRSMVAAAARGA
ncbi:MAG: hypothetical protein RL354_1709 [Planctomycetota bacterium]